LFQQLKLGIKSHNLQHNMKARSESGKVVKYSRIPSEWKGTKHYIGGFHNATTQELEAEGFYDVIEPVYDPVIQVAHNLHITAYAYTDIDGNELTRDAFVYDIKAKTISETVAELKVIHIKALKSLAYGKLSPTDWYAIRKAEKGTDIPSGIQTERDAIRTSVITKEGEINALTTKAAILRYDINF